MSFREDIAAATAPDPNSRTDWRLEGSGVQGDTWMYKHRYVVGQTYLDGGTPQTFFKLILPTLAGEAKFFNTATLWVYAQTRITDNPRGFCWICQTNRYTQWTPSTSFNDMVVWLANGDIYHDMTSEWYNYAKSYYAPYHVWVPFRIGYLSAETEAGVPKGVKAMYEENGYQSCEIGVQLALAYYIPPGDDKGLKILGQLDGTDTHVNGASHTQFISSYNFNPSDFEIGVAPYRSGVITNAFEYAVNPDLKAFVHFSYEPIDLPPPPPVDPPERGGAVRSIEELIADTTIHIGQLSHARRIISTAQRQRNLMYRNEDSPSSIKTNILVHQDNAGNVVSQALTDLKALNFQHQIVSKCLPEQLLRVETGKNPPAGSTMTKYLNERYYLIGMNLWEDSDEVEMGWSISYITVSHLRHYGATDSGYLDEATGWDDFLPGDTVRIETSAVFPDGRSASGTYRIGSKGAGVSLGSHLNIQGLWGTPVQDATVYVPDCVITLLERSPV